MDQAKNTGFMAKTGVGITSLLLLLLIPLTALAIEYTPLVTIEQGLKYPTDMAVSAVNGTVYVVDGLSSKVLTYDSTYRYTGSITAAASPIAVAVSPAGKVYIADNKTHSVKIIDPGTRQETGSLMKYGAKATFLFPRNIAVGPDNVIYVVDQLAESIEVFSAAGTYSTSITGLEKPQDAVATATELFIIDHPLVQNGARADGTPYMLASSRILTYDFNTESYIEDHSFPGFGNNAAIGEYISLKGIAIDSQGYIYVSDSFMQVVYKYSPAMTIDNGDGTTTDITLGTFIGPLNDGFANPLGMTASGDGRLFVTSSFDGIVKVFGVDTVAGAETWLKAPVADAGLNQQVDEGANFVLDGSASADPDGIITYQWTQVAGTLVLDENPLVIHSGKLALTAPDVGPEGATMSFELVVTDPYSLESEIATTTVTVNNIITGSVVINDGAQYTNDRNVSLTLDAPEAVEMEIANDSDQFTDSYSPCTDTCTGTHSWTLSDYDPAIAENTKTVRVKFRDAGGNTVEASSTILLDMQPPAVPVIDTGSPSGVLNWTSVDGAVSYTLEYALNSDFSDAVILTGLDSNSLALILNDLAYGTWSWRVCSIDVAGNISGWSDVGTFVNAPPNEQPVADAGLDQTVSEGTSFILDGSASTDDDGIIEYQWTQTAGDPVLIAGTPVLIGDSFITESQTIEVTAPDVDPEGAILTFELVVTDAYSLESEIATTTVTVHNVITGLVVINGGAQYSNEQNVTLSLDAPEAVEMEIVNDSDQFTDSYSTCTETCTGIYSWTLSDYDPAFAENIKTVRVKFRDAGGNTVEASSTILLDMLPPAAPGIDTNGPAGQLNWTSVDDAVSYTLEYASNSSFEGAETITGLVSNGLPVPANLPYGTWFWKVQSIDAAGNVSAWSDGQFYIDPDCSSEVPAIPELAKPYNNDTGVSRTVTLETNGMNYPALCGIHWYTTWQVSRTSDFSDPGTLVMAVDTTLYNLTKYQIPELVLEPGNTYYWRVRQTASGGMQSDWSDTWLFTTESVSDEQGVGGVLYVESDPDAAASGEEINIKEPIGDANVKIKAIRVNYGVVAQTIKELDPYAIPDSVNKPSSFPLGLLSFRFTVEPGSSAQVEVTFSGSVPQDAEWYIYNVEDGWHVYADASFSRNRRSVTLNFVDGGDGDTDGAENGVIVNP